MEAGRLEAILDLDMSGFSKSLEGAQKQLQGIGERMKGVGATMSAAVTLPMAAVGGVLLNGAMEAQNAQGVLQAALGTTAEQAKQLGDVAKEVWSGGFGESIDEVTGALTTVKQNLQGISDNELPGITEGALTIQKVFGEDVTATTAAAGVMMKSFGIEGQEALDLITVGFQKGGNFSGELLDTMREYGPQFAEMGFSADEMLNVLIKGTEAGAWNLDKVGDAIKEFHLRAQDGSKTTAEGFAAIGLNAEEMGAKIAQGGEEGQKAFMATVAALSQMTDPLAQDAAGVALFGTQWEDVRAKVIATMADGKNAIGDFKGATAEASAAMVENNPAAAWTQAFREMQIAVGPVLLDVANIVTNTVAPAIKGVSEFFGELPGPIKTIIVIVAGLVAAIGPLLVAFGAIASAVSTLGPVIAALTGPIGIVIAIISALVAAGVYLYKHWDELKAKATDIFNGIKETISTSIETAKNTALNIFNGMKTGVSGIFTSIIGGVTGSMSSLYNTVRSGLESAWSYIKSIPSQAAGWGRQIIQSLASGIKSIHIPMPHFSAGFKSVSVAGVSFKMPDIDVNWYDKGGVFYGPQVVGVGEKRPEFVGALDDLRKIVREESGGAGGPIQLLVNLDGRVISQQLYNIEKGQFRGGGRK